MLPPVRFGKVRTHLQFTFLDRDLLEAQAQVPSRGSRASGKTMETRFEGVVKFPHKYHNLDWFS